MSTFCPECKGSGESGQFGVLDCAAPNCTAATERAALDTHLLALGRLHERDLVWEAYKLGQASREAWKPLSDTQWVNIVNQDDAFDGMSKDEAVTRAVNMTAVKLKEINSGNFAAPANNNTEKADE